MDALEESQAGPEEEFSQKLMRAGQSGDHAADFVARHDQRDAFGPGGADQAVKLSEFLVNDFVIKENQCVESLVLRGGRDLSVESQV